MNKVRFLRPSFFVWPVVPLIACLATSAFGLPHVIWSYEWRGPAARSDDIAVRHYTICTYVGPYGVFTVRADDGACDLIRFFQPQGAPR